MTIHITTPQGLQDMNLDLTADYILDNNLDMTGFSWTPIANAGSFTGSFDGQNFTISNLTSDDTGGSVGYAGLFAFLDVNSVVQNVILDGAILIVNHNTTFGALVGFTDTTTVTNCHVTNVTIQDDGNGGTFSFSGGFCGISDRSTFSGCDISGTMTIACSKIWDVGGFCGDSDTNNSYEDCFSSLIISVTGNGTDTATNVGGFVGTEATNSGTADYQGCYCDGNLTFDNFTGFGGIGGFVGILDTSAGSSTIDSCYYSGDIVCSNGGNNVGIGGFIGLDQSNDLTMNKCYSDGSVSFDGTTDFATGGFIGQVFQGSRQVTNCYSQSNVSSVVSVEGFGTGGFIGEFTDATTNTFKNCYSSGTVSGSDVVGGFIGFFGSTSADLINCYSVGVITGSGSFIGGFFGFAEVISAPPTITNCAWYTGSSTNPVGRDAPVWSSLTTYGMGGNVYVFYNDGVHKAIYQSLQNGNLNHTPVFTGGAWWVLIIEIFDTLNDYGWGTDENDKTKFYKTNHVVYDQGNANAWDFATPIWYERVKCTDYPTFVPCPTPPQTISIDCGILGVVTSTITGLSHLEGQTVSILADGEVLPQQVVQNGTITLPDSYAKVIVGLPFESDLETLNIDQSQPGDSMQGKKIKIGNVIFRVTDTRGGWVGPNEKVLYEAFNKAIIDKLGVDDLSLLFTGDIRMPLGAGYEDGGRIFYKQKDPTGVTINAIIPEIKPGGPSG